MNNKHWSDAKRVKEVVSALMTEGLGYFVDRLKLRWHLPLYKNLQFYEFKEKDHIPLQVRIRRSMERLGGAYLKLGQLLSLRPDLVPLEYCKEFEKLQDQVPPFAFAKAKETIEQEMGKNIYELFKHFEEKPVGSASIGQVHRATLKDGTNVVVKVQRPRIQEIFHEDIDILYYLFRKLDKYYRYENFSPLIILKEFEKYTERELDYRFERHNIEVFEGNFRNSKFIKIPHVYGSYSTSRILTMEYIEGQKLSELLASKKKFPKEKIAKNLVETALSQVFETDIFHADLHPGNILVLPDGKIGLLDFGIVGSLDEELRSKGIDLFVAILEKDVQGVLTALTRMGEVHEDANLEALKSDIHDIILHWHGAKLSEVRVTHMLHQLFDACLKQHVALPTDLILLGKALVTAEGTCMKLDPSFNFVEIAQPRVHEFLQKKLRRSLHPKHLLNDALLFKDTIKEVPQEMLDVLDTIKRGKLQVDISKDEVSHLTQELDRSSNRMAFSMIIASLIVGGALLTQVQTEQLIFNIPYFAFICFSAAAFLGIFLMISIFHEGKWRRSR